MSVFLKLSKSSKKRFENNSVVITQKTSKGILFFIQSNISKIDRLRDMRKEKVKLINYLRCCCAVLNLRQAQV